MQKRVTRSTTPARTRRIARRIRLRRRRADWLREPLPFARERLLPEGFQADRGDLHPLSLDNFSAQTFHPAQHAVFCMFASSSTPRPATVGQGLLCVLVGTGMSVSADLKIGGSPPPPESRSAAQSPRAAIRPMGCPGSSAAIWLALVKQVAVGSRRSAAHSAARRRKAPSTIIAGTASSHNKAPDTRLPPATRRPMVKRAMGIDKTGFPQPFLGWTRVARNAIRPDVAVDSAAHSGDRSPNCQRQSRRQPAAAKRRRNRLERYPQGRRD
jgi:hypothetical protein